MISVGALTPILVCFHKLEITPPSNSNHLRDGTPEGFRSALSGAVASVILCKQGRSYSRLGSELRERAVHAKLSEPAALLRRLGTLEDRSGTVVPVHDLYWSWLGGLGLLAEDRIQASLAQLATRECYELALESGALPKSSMVGSARNTDITLAALLAAYLGADKESDDGLLSALKAMFTDERMPVRCRAALAALRSGKSDLIRSALNVLTEIREAKLYVHAFDIALTPDNLFPNRGILTEWLGAVGTDKVIDAIAMRGDPSWGPWLAQAATSGKLPKPIIVGAALACEGRVPEWTVEHLPTVAKTEPWELRRVANRGTNTELARWLAEHYDELVDLKNSGWFHLNRVLVGCGDDATFDRLLSRFDAMPVKAQETLGFAIVDRGDPWIARFQEKAFASGAPRYHHKLAEVVSLGIDDTTARRWIANGPSELGWRVLIARHGQAIIPEMVAALPESFGNLHDVPALSAMRFLTDAPPSLVDEITKRMGSPMQPKAMQDVINALARVRATGVPSIVGLIFNNPLLLPTYHLAQALRLVPEWENETHLKLRVRSGSGNTPFAEWILLARLPQDRNDHMFRRALAGERDFAVRVILSDFRDDESAVRDILGGVEPLARYHEDLFEFLIANPNLCALALKVFSGTFDTFPESALLRVVDAPGTGFGELLRALATATSPAHSALHRVLITKLLARPLDLFDYREMAKILRAHPREELVGILKEVIVAMGANEMWLVREIEAERGELLIDETGQWL